MTGITIVFSSDEFPLREWTGPDGETTYALSPLLIGMNRDLQNEGIKPTAAGSRERWQEYVDGNRILSDELVDFILLADADQRRNGYDGPPIVHAPSVDDSTSIEDDLAACRRILARAAVLLRQGRIQAALAEIPVTEHELLAEQVMGEDLPPRRLDEARR
jgi:hypothetical protein